MAGPCGQTVGAPILPSPLIQLCARDKVSPPVWASVSSWMKGENSDPRQILSTVPSRSQAPDRCLSLPAPPCSEETMQVPGPFSHKAATGLSSHSLGIYESLLRGPLRPHGSSTSESPGDQPGLIKPRSKPSHQIHGAGPEDQDQSILQLPM